jgi:hypothetical protein
VLARVLLEPAGEEMVVAELAIGLEAKEHDPRPSWVSEISAERPTHDAHVHR